MKIRSITFFINPLTMAAKTLQELSEVGEEIKQAIQARGIEVQTLRLSTQPFSKVMKTSNSKDFTGIEWIVELEDKAVQNGFTYLSIGPALIGHPESYALIPQILANTKNVFASAMIADQEHGIDFFALDACSRIIMEAMPLEENGFANLRFCASANVEPLGPFFPSSYYDDAQPAGFSIAMEAADEVLNAFSSADSFSDARTRLLAKLDHTAFQLEEIILGVLQKSQLKFFGFDFSVAPYPQDFCSLGCALEELGVPSLGNHGSLAAAAFLAETLDRGSWKRVGFNGLMLPLLEDSRLAQRSIDGTLSLKDLLMFSAVCGTGLDTIPVAGDVTAGEIQAVLLDVAALSSRLRKPLTARLMPIPGKKAGELTSFDFEFFKNGRILKLEVEPLTNLLLGAKENLIIRPRPTA
jgi:uncharacterized protein (UPF0210 family)